MYRHSRLMCCTNDPRARKSKETRDVRCGSGKLQSIQRHQVCSEYTCQFLANEAVRFDSTRNGRSLQNQCCRSSTSSSRVNSAVGAVFTTSIHNIGTCPRGSFRGWKECQTHPYQHG